MITYHVTAFGILRLDCWTWTSRVYNSTQSIASNWPSPAIKKSLCHKLVSTAIQLFTFPLFENFNFFGNKRCAYLGFHKANIKLLVQPSQLMEIKLCSNYNETVLTGLFSWNKGFFSAVAAAGRRSPGHCLGDCWWQLSRQRGIISYNTWDGYSGHAQCLVGSHHLFTPTWLSPFTIHFSLLSSTCFSPFFHLSHPWSFQVRPLAALCLIFSQRERTLWSDRSASVTGSLGVTGAGLNSQSCCCCWAHPLAVPASYWCWVPSQEPWTCRTIAQTIVGCLCTVIAIALTRRSPSSKCDLWEKFV